MRLDASLLKQAAKNCEDIKLAPGSELWIRAGNGKYVLNGSDEEISVFKLQCKLSRQPDAVIVIQDLTK